MENEYKVVVNLKAKGMWPMPKSDFPIQHSSSHLALCLSGDYWKYNLFFPFLIKRIFII